MRCYGCVQVGVNAAITFVIGKTPTRASSFSRSNTKKTILCYVDTVYSRFLIVLEVTYETLSSLCHDRRAHAQHS
jgi:hypothetical protein